VIERLRRDGMPFIRYATGDRAVAGNGLCSCGRGLPLLGEVPGRQLDVLTTPDGRPVPGEFFPHLLKDFPAVRRFQVVQDVAEEILLRLVLTETTEDVPPRIEMAVRSIVGEAVRLRIERVDDTPLTRSGKLRVVVNRANNGGVPNRHAPGDSDSAERVLL
jgi:phenylacetate-CoA ligase